MSYASGPIGETTSQPAPQPQRPVSSSLLTTHEQELANRPIPHSRPPYHRWLIVCFFLAFLSYLLYLQTRPDIGDNGLLRGISDIFVLFGSLVCTFWCWRTTWQLQKMRVAAPLTMARRAWLAWICLGGAALSYSIGQAIWTWYDANYTSANLPFPAIYDPFYLLVYPLSWVGIALLIPNSGSAAGRTRLLLDAGIAVASALAVTWYFLLGPTIETLNGPVLTKVVALAYPLGDFSLCFAAALLLFGPSGHVTLNATLRRLAIGVTLLAITDSLYGYFQLQYTYHTGLMQDIGWPMSWLFIGWAATLYPDGLTRLTGQYISDEWARPGRMGTTGTVLRAITPLGLALLTCTLLIIEIALRNTESFTQVILVCAGLFLLPVIRQVLTLIDNMVLNERLRVALSQSQQAFQSSQQALLSTTSRAEQYEELRAGIEDLKTVHAALVRGDFRIRAQVQGPLSPVALSLNLLIERMSNWSQYIQINHVLETEVSQLRRLLDDLSDGKVNTRLPKTRSVHQTGGAMLSAIRLQSRLSSRFGQIRESINQTGKHWQAMTETIQQTKKNLPEGSSREQQLQTTLEALSRIEKRLASSRAVLQELWHQSKVYEQDETSISNPVRITEKEV